jgi:hypothetical protein
VRIVASFIRLSIPFLPHYDPIEDLGLNKEMVA